MRTDRTGWSQVAVIVSSIFSHLDLLSRTEVKVEDRTEFEAEYPARVRSTRRPYRSSSRFNRQTHWLLSQCHDFSHLQAKRDSGSAGGFLSEAKRTCKQERSRR